MRALAVACALLASCRSGPERETLRVALLTDRVAALPALEAALPGFRLERTAPETAALWVGEPAVLEANAPQLRPIPSVLLKTVGPGLTGPGDGWVALVADLPVVIAGRLVVNAPRSVLDLGEPRWHGSLARPPLGGEPLRRALATAIAERGEAPVEALLRAFQDGDPDHEAWRPDEAAVLAAVEAGDAAIGVLRASVWLDALPSGDDGTALASSRLQLIPLDAAPGGAVPYPLAAALPASSGAAAEQALAALLAPAGQTALSAALRRFPVADDAQPTPLLAPLGPVHWSTARPGAVADALPRIDAWLAVAELR
jgi:ABC-type Fe3+ transport system substrate-binding protein